MPQDATNKVSDALPECKSDWTHFIMEGERLAHGFSVESCEQCGCQVEAANSVCLHEPRRKLLALGMVEVDNCNRLPEMGWCDALGCACCPTCYVYNDNSG